MLSGLNVNMGVLESDVPDLFNDVHVGWSTWSEDYYTVNGSNELTDLENTAGEDFAASTLTGITVGGTAPMAVTTDGDGTKWLVRASAWTNYFTMGFQTATQELVDEDADGFIITASLRATATQIAGTNESMEGWGLNGSIQPGSAYFAGNSQVIGGFAVDDMEFRMQSNDGLIGPNGDTNAEYGPWKGLMGTGGSLVEGGYDPNGNILTTPAYLFGADIVVSMFYQTSGIRLMINGQFVDMRVAACRNVNGTIKANPYDLPAETAFFAQDASMPQMIANAGGTPGVDPSALGMGILDTLKCDYMAIHSGSKTDQYMRTVQSMLLNQKPT